MHRYELELPAMSCGHCKSTITGVLQAQEAGLELDFDLPARKLRVAGGLTLERLRSLLAGAGYPVAAARELAEN